VAACDDDSDNSPEGQPSAQTADQVSLLFIQDAGQGTLDTTAGTLTLTDASPTITYFSNRPERVAGQMSFASLVSDWDRLYGDDPPNAGVQHLGSANGARAAVVELLKAPTYDGDRTVTYRVRPLDTPADAPERISFREVSLFIDAGLAGRDSLDSGAVANHCSPMDPRCGFVAKNDKCSPMDPRCGFAAPDAAPGCSPIDPRDCGGSAANDNCFTDPLKCEGPSSKAEVNCEEDPNECRNLVVINKQGNGAGTVTSEPAGIDCGSDCQYDFGGIDQTTLTAIAASGSTFEGWSGGSDCSGTGTCTVVFNLKQTPVTATFSDE
jgi:hypothetical protein